MTSRRHKNTRNATSQGPSTFHGKILDMARPVDPSHDSETAGETNEIFGEPPINMKNDIDSNLLSQNRGNAVLRYKEKRKNRRSDTVCFCSCSFNSLCNDILARYSNATFATFLKFG